MQFPESWLREFCDPPIGTQALADLLTLSGMEVEDLRPVAPPFSGVVVGEIVACDQHPQADRLRVCLVEAGRHTAEGPLQIVCGAPNARVGIRVPLAMVGAELPPADDSKDGQPFRIGVGKLRGVESRGMLCSARELKIADDHGGLLELAPDAPPGADIRQWLRLDDTVFTLKLTPNLGHVLSVFGVAREVAALTGSPLKMPAIEPVKPAHDLTLPVQVQAKDLCGRFSGRVVRGVDTKARTPAWMVERLARCGQRSVTALVDISNYVMFEFGQPSHIFDLDKIHDGLVVRWGRVLEGKGETLKLLNGSTVELDETVGVIADGQGVESLAGIMGGDATAVSDDTRNIYIEAAFWWPDAVSGRSRRYAFATDAGHRFERGVDPARTVAMIERITALVQQVCGGEAGPMTDQVLALPEAKPVALRVDRASRIVGLPITQALCAEVFTRLGLAFSEAPGVLTVTPPSWRFDLKIEEDLVEEVIRVHGYDKLPSAAPLAPIVPQVRPEGRRSTHQLRRQAAALGYQEVISFSFVEERWERELAGNADPIRVLNPIAAPLAVMRTSLLGSLVGVLKNNLARRAQRVRVVELGAVYLRDPAAPAGETAVAGLRQPRRIAGLAYGTAAPLQWGDKERPVDFFDVKGDVAALLAPLAARWTTASHPAMHPGRCAAVWLDGGTAPIGHVGELHPRWRQQYELPQAPVLFELDLDALLAQPVPTFAALPRQQPAWRDVALVVGETVAYDAVRDALMADPRGLVRRATLFDVYRLGEGDRSLAIRLELLDERETLTDDRIEDAKAAAVARAAAACGARLRG
jgi:phenylalanyl-tRNA synthetase beta chain